LLKHFLAVLLPSYWEHEVMLYAAIRRFANGNYYFFKFIDAPISSDMKRILGAPAGAFL
jgi:hypothetical protein